MNVDPAVRRLIDGVLVPGFVGTSPPDWLRAALDDGLAGVCWFAQNVPDLETARRLSNELHAVRDDALVLCDEEGGGVTRLEADSGSSWPGNAALGVVDDLDATRLAGSGVGHLARAAGVDVALAPAVDVNSAPDNPVIGVRSFGADPDRVARHGAAFVHGLQSAGVAACAKHFPGHGSTRVDSHLRLPTVDADAETVWRRDLSPFAAVVDAGVRCVLTAHVVYPAFDSQPATMSGRWMSLLRDELGFDGVVISDALDMRAISGSVGRGAGAVAALRAGVDLLCIGNPCFPEEYDAAAVLDEVRHAIVDAVDEGWLSVDRLRAAADRIAALAAWRAAATPAASTPDAGAGRDLARRAIRGDGVEPLRAAPVVIVERRTDIAAGPRRSWIEAELTARWPETVAYAAQTPDDLATARASWGIGSSGAGRRPVVVVTDGLSGDDLWRAVRAERPDAVVVHTGPDGSAGTVGPPIVRAFGAGRVVAEAVAELLAEPTGALPGAIS